MRKHWVVVVLAVLVLTFGLFLVRPIICDLFSPKPHLVENIVDVYGTWVVRINISKPQHYRTYRLLVRTERILVPTSTTFPVTRPSSEFATLSDSVARQTVHESEAIVYEGRFDTPLTAIVVVGQPMNLQDLQGKENNSKPTTAMKMCFKAVYQNGGQSMASKVHEFQGRRIIRLTVARKAQSWNSGRLLLGRFATFGDDEREYFKHELYLIGGILLR